MPTDRCIRIPIGSELVVLWVQRLGLGNADEADHTKRGIAASRMTSRGCRWIKRKDVEVGLSRPPGNTLQMASLARVSISEVIVPRYQSSVVIIYHSQDQRIHVSLSNFSGVIYFADVFVFKIQAIMCSKTFS